jgi:hypothetical protein
VAGPSAGGADAGLSLQANSMAVSNRVEIANMRMDVSGISIPMVDPFPS